MASVGTLFGVELAKLIRRPMTWITAAILLGFSVLIYAVLILTLVAPGLQDSVQVESNDPMAGLQESVLLPDGFAMGISLVQSVGVVLVIILAAGMLGSEFSWGTLRTMVLMRADRTRILVAKLLTLLLIAIVITLVGIGIGLVGPIVAGLVLGEGLRTAEWANAEFLRGAAIASLATLVAVTLWALIGTTLTVFTRSLAGGIGISLAAYFVGDIGFQIIASIGRVGVWITRLFPNTAINALNQLGLMSNPPTYGASDWAWIIANLLIYTVALTVIGIVRIRRVNLLASS